MTELATVQRVLAWATPGDVLALLVHDRKVRDPTIEILRPDREGYFSSP
jgi:hypothetical protein